MPNSTSEGKDMLLSNVGGMEWVEMKHFFNDSVASYIEKEAIIGAVALHVSKFVILSKASPHI